MSLLSLLRSSATIGEVRGIHARILIDGLPLENHLLAKLASLRSPAYTFAVFRSISSPNYHSFAALLKSCSTLSSAGFGRQIHCQVFKLCVHRFLLVGNSLIQMYCKCSKLNDARQLLDEMPERDSVSYNSLISGYARCGDVTLASEVFHEMPAERTVVGWTALIDGFGRSGMVGEMLGFFRRMLLSPDDGAKPNSTTLVCLVSAVETREVGRWVSSFLDVNSMARDIILSTALVAMFSRCGELGKARRIFEDIPTKCLPSWNAMLTGYVRNGLAEEAVALFRSMRLFVAPNEITMVNLFSACASLGALELGREGHMYVARKGLGLNRILVTALVDMYSKCGSIDEACLAFVKSGEKDVILWNAMIMGLAVHGHGWDALRVFADLERVGDRPNDATFIGVLSACCHSGLAEEAKANFVKMFGYGLTPKVEHYACYVDLLGRAGRLEDAILLIRSMEIPPDSVIWGSLLNACRIHREIELADEVGQLMSSLGDSGLGSCILLSNIYASASRWGDVARVRRMVKEKGTRKPSGCSWIEVDGSVHTFLVEDAAHVRSLEVYVMLTNLMRQLGSDDEPMFEFDLENISES